MAQAQTLDNDPRRQEAGRGQEGRMLLRGRADGLRAMKLAMRDLERARDGCEGRRAERAAPTRVEQSAERVDKLTKEIAELVEGWSLAPLVRSLQALRGVAAELGPPVLFRLGAQPHAVSWTRAVGALEPARASSTAASHADGKQPRQTSARRDGMGAHEMIAAASTARRYRPAGRGRA